MSQLDVHIYEAASQFSQVGAGINIWGRVRKIFTDLGLEADLARLLREDDIGCEYEACTRGIIRLTSATRLYMPQERPGGRADFPRRVYRER